MTITRHTQITAESGSTSEFFITDYGTSPTLENTVVYSGVYCWRTASANGSLGAAFRTSVSGFRAGFYMRHHGAGSGRACILFAHDLSGPGYGIRIWYDEDTQLVYLEVDGVTVDSVGAAESGIIDQDTWRHIGVAALSGSDGYVSFYVDGVCYLTFAGAVRDSIDYVLYGGRGTGFGTGWNPGYFDDFYLDELTDEADAAPPSKRFLGSVVDGPISAEWLPVGDPLNYRNVDDPAAPDGDTTYNRTPHNGNRDLFSLTPITLPANHVIRAVIPYAVARKTDAGTDAQLSLIVFDGLNTAVGAANFTPISYTYLWNRFTVEPDGAGWDESDYNTMRYGYLSQGSF